ncbi:hypothetical protein HYC85_000523 [Camellia sinensis]|uniref:LisH domain-containing protein n=1 Tax=Camellia sinensis TaxID=4442 RepID=A0A7J7I4J4_CAMSI|nr:hypothetical protein HYC85_000523 [Camellia sinensis]
MADESTQEVELIGRHGLIKKHELVRVIIQCLYSLGFNISASQLEQESNVSRKNSQFTVLESLIMEGNWQEKDRASVLQNILGQCILEYAERGDYASGLRFLRRDYSEFGVLKRRIDRLGMELLFRDDRMRELSHMRRELVYALEITLPPPFAMSDRRLEKLVEVSVYISDVPQYPGCDFSLSGPLLPRRRSYPNSDYSESTEKTVLNSHENEVLFVQFSHNGAFLASASRDCTAIIWKVPEQGNLTVERTLRGHENPVYFLSWSPDDTMLATCGEETLNLWDVETGVRRFSFQPRVPILSSCAWFPDSTRIVFGSCGPRKCIYRLKINENRLTRWVRTNKPKITDLAITSDGENFICVFSQEYNSYIIIWNQRRHTKFVISEMSPITSVCVSADSLWLLVNLSGHEIPLVECCRKLRFFASGSEDSQVYIWHIESPEPIKILRGHLMVVNCVSWNQRRPEMLASASDDKTIRIWMAASHIN